jgi:hypothetical protein
MGINGKVCNIFYSLYAIHLHYIAHKKIAPNEKH